jgi:uncharacterized protein YhfF
MIFSEEHVAMILAGTKTQTRRLAKSGELLMTRNFFWDYVNSKGRIKWMQERTYAVQPGRGKTAVARIRLKHIHRESLKTISIEDAHAEGGYTIEEFTSMWNSFHTQTGTRWEDNPLVWVLAFELV